MNYRVYAFCASLFLFLPIAQAGTIRFDPPNATIHHSVDVTVSGTWADACTPRLGNAVVAGSIITLHLEANPPIGILCAQVQRAYSHTWHLGVLPAGGYTVIAVADRGGLPAELGRTLLIVRDTETIGLLPYAVPTSGGQILILNPFAGIQPTLTIGGVAVPVNSSGAILGPNAPPHVPGVVDVVISSTLGTVASTAALIYYDPAAADPAVFEPILFPLSFQGPGALGSQWTTESFINDNGSRSYFRDPLPCDGCSTLLSSGFKQLNTNTNPWGHVLYVLRGRIGALAFASRIRDTSRQLQTAGTEVPVVHERDFRSDLRFMNVPAESRYRITLRLWSLGDYPQFLVANGINSEPQIALSVIRIPGTDMWFGSADVTPLLKGNFNPTVVTVVPSGGYPAVTSVFYPSIWGMLSITNNDTQQVTIVSPK